MSNYTIEMLGITKQFPGVLANDKVNLQVKQNEVHALLGENGAGKSTLMSILFGSYDADAGEIKIRGKNVKIKSPNDATVLGIGMVHQHFKLVTNYTVTENIVLGIESKTKLGLLDLKKAEKRVKELSDQYGLKVNPKDKIEDISVGMQQRVEILKMLYRNADILILDEPSAVLTPQEIDDLMSIVRRLKNEGKTIILITHKLKEIKAVADRCSVLRRGKYIDTIEVKNVSEEKMAEMMVGRPVHFDIEKAPLKLGETVLNVEKLQVKDYRGHLAVQNLSFSIKKGEIFGIAGVDGNGQTELIYALTGLVHTEAGTIKLHDKDITKQSIKERIQAGIGHIPEDRHRHGLVLDFSLGENAVLKNYDTKEFSNNLGVLQYQIISEHTNKLIKEYDIRVGEGVSQKAGSLSGGNQQKLIIAREVALSPELLIVAQPTRGLDVGAIEYIRKRLVEERDKGRAILLISFELEEIMSLCDRIAIISKGEFAGIFNEGELTENEIGFMMAGAQAKDRLKNEVIHE